MARGSRKGAVLDPVLVFAVDDIVGKPALPEGEAPRDYDLLLNRLRLDMAPTDVLEEVWLRDITHLVLDAVRYRRVKRGLLRLAGAQAMLSIIAQQTPSPFDKDIEARLKKQRN